MPFVSGTIVDDVSFLRDWEKSDTYDLSALLRVRQIYRANPPLARRPSAASGSSPAPGAGDVRA